MAMAGRWLLFLALFLSLGADHRSANFLVQAPTPEAAAGIAQAAELQRRLQAQAWVGQELPAWPQLCPLVVHVQLSGASGATTFRFAGGRVVSQKIEIAAAWDRLGDVLAHEITHTVFASHFGQALPRWADEGAAVLSEGAVELQRYDRLCREILNTPGRAWPLRRLFTLQDYPHDVLVVYAEGSSVVEFLVAARGRPAFLSFVGAGMGGQWDLALQRHYGYRSVDDLEMVWRARLRATRLQPAAPAGHTVPLPGT